MKTIPKTFESSSVEELVKLASGWLESFSGVVVRLDFGMQRPWAEPGTLEGGLVTATLVLWVNPDGRQARQAKIRTFSYGEMIGGGSGSDPLEWLDDQVVQWLDAERLEAVDSALLPNRQPFTTLLVLAQATEG